MTVSPLWLSRGEVSSSLTRKLKLVLGAGGTLSFARSEPGIETGSVILAVSPWWESVRLLPSVDRVVLPSLLEGSETCMVSVRMLIKCSA